MSPAEWLLATSSSMPSPLTAMYSPVLRAACPVSTAVTAARRGEAAGETGLHRQFRWSHAGPMAKLTLYTLASCDTCRQAKAWLSRRGWAFEEKPIREHPPTSEELTTMLAAYGGEIRRLVNTAGREFRALGLGETLPTLREDEVIALLAGNGSLVKRPFLIGERVALVGFDESSWSRALG